MPEIQDRGKYISRVTLVGSAINLILTLFKFGAGILGHSSALVADAAHSLSDFASDVIALFFIRVAARPEDRDHAYGHGKFETLASVAIGLILLATGIGFLWKGCAAIIEFARGGQLATPAWLALIAALASILIKEGLYQYTIKAAKKVDSGILRTNAWHHRSDSLSSIATVAGIGGAMLPGAGWQILDPLAACLISLFIIGMAISLMRPGIDELLEKSLPETDLAQIEKIIRETPGIVAYHHLRTRRVGINRAIEVHIKLPGDCSLADAHNTATILEKAIRDQLGKNTHVGIHMEPAKPVKESCW